MILRRVIDHVKAQNWTAVALDFAIVVIGVFVGIQLGNWNTGRAERAREMLLLGELRGEIADAIRQTETKQKAYEQVGLSGARAVAFLDAGESCGDQCWPIVVDFFHASQWQLIDVRLSTYEELRRNGWPRNREIVDAIETYQRQAENVAAPLLLEPPYRELVRGLIPLAIHKPYWATCFVLVDGEEKYVENCPESVAPEISAAGAAAIASHPDIHRTLTAWVGFAAASAESMLDQNVTARRALELIDAELEAN